MGRERSTATPAVPAALAPVLVALGWIGLVLAQTLASVIGFRPTLIVGELLLVAPGLLALALMGLPIARALGLSRISGREAGLSVLFGGAFWCASLGLFELQYAVWKPPPGYLEAFKRLHEMLKPTGPLDASFSLLAIAVGPAVCEELLFRGIVLPSLAVRVGPALATLGSSFLFGLIHVDLGGGGLSMYRVPFAFAVGLGLGLLRVRAGRLWPAVLAHAVLNSITFAAAPHAEQGEPATNLALGSALFLGGTALAAALFHALGSVDSPREARLHSRS
jgi:sodium transport system permease protein